jgi:hypothetical protein
MTCGGDPWGHWFEPAFAARLGGASLRRRGREPRCRPRRCGSLLPRRSRDIVVGDDALVAQDCVPVELDNAFRTRPSTVRVVRRAQTSIRVQGNACPSGVRSGKRSGTKQRSLCLIRADAVSKTEGRRFEPCRPCPL